jgi:glucosamine--fructose-6-phosphate aminotransferase (isomerizing)
MADQQFAHHMLKEIFENPQAVRDTVLHRISPEGDRVVLEDFHLSDDELRKVQHIAILASGTSRHAGLAGKIMIQKLAGVRVEVDYASEAEFADQTVASSDLTISITQSGQTRDTISALNAAKAAGSKTLAICNVVGASIAQQADAVIYTYAGPEIAIASTKAFTAQLAALFLFAVYLGQLRGHLTPEEVKAHLAALLELPEKLEKVLETCPCSEGLAEKYFLANDFLFLGRSVHYSAALDGALKLKEVSYIHAEAYPAGEIKHGPYALVDATMPLVCVAGKDASDEGSVLRYNMTLQNMRDVRERLGRVICVAVEGCDEVLEITKDVIFVPSASELLLPLLEIVPLQFLAYYMALRRGLNVDSPRNLVKAVTSE